MGAEPMGLKGSRSRGHVKSLFQNGLEGLKGEIPLEGRARGFVKTSKGFQARRARPARASPRLVAEWLAERKELGEAPGTWP